MIYRLDNTTPQQHFPDPAQAEEEPNGLLAVGGDLHPRRLLNAYASGIFPWYSDDQPILWWSPNPRTVLYPDAIHVSRSLRKQMRRGGCELRIDSDFEGVIRACAAPRHDDAGTWLLPEMQEAYLALHRLGHAHSIELWQDDDLVGGLYGIALGAAFFGESMFSRVPSASRMTLVYLCARMSRFGGSLIDCQVFNPHLARMGACEIPRERFLAELGTALRSSIDPRIWRADPLPVEQLVDPVQGDNRRG
ncbi:MAG: leucyl/phenylalanyl-tRNA--protein transferase [Gammaproteobacteria bacterium]|nr:MAG: leucyl/phenylalanyl-tRNA--protein transferase [Gammaproteobacteria bacterium]